MAIVKATYLSRSRIGTPATTKAITRAAKYYTFRDGPDRATRQWHTSDGRTTTYDAIADELRCHARTHAYSYRVVLSTKDAKLGPASYHQALRTRFETYYFIQHGNTNFPHAHVIGFRANRFTRAELQTMHGQVAALEQAQHQRNLARHQEHAAERTVAAPQAQRHQRHDEDLALERD